MNIKFSVTIKKVIAHPNHKQKFCEDSRRYVEHLNQNYDYHDIEYLNDDEMKEVTGSETYFGGSYDKGEAHCHPLNYALGILVVTLFIAIIMMVYQNGKTNSLTCHNCGQKRTRLDNFCSGCGEKL